MTVRLFSMVLGAIGLLSIFASLPENESAGALNSTSVMTYNIHIEGCTHDHPSWIDRRSLVAQVIRLKSPEILGLQGTTIAQLDWLINNLGHFSASYNQSSADAASDVCPILFDQRVYRAMEKGTETLDLSDHNGESNIFVNWVKLEHLLSSRTLYIINTSMEEQNISEMDDRAVDEMRNIISTIVGPHTFIMLGDMVPSDQQECIDGFTSWAKDSQKSSLVSISDIEETYVGWERGNKGVRKDYVLLSNDIPANSHEVVNVAFQNKFPSDHLPVFCRIRLK